MLHCFWLEQGINFLAVVELPQVPEDGHQIR